MPEFTVKEVRLPELHLPEIKRDEIVRSLSGIHLPEVDLAKARRAGIKVPPVTLTSSDVGRLIAAVARFVRPAPSRGRWLTGLVGRRLPSPIARIVQPRPSRSRWPIVFGAMIVAAFGAWMLLRRPVVRRRVEEAGRRARERFDELRSRGVRPAVVSDEPASGEYPDGLGSSAADADGIPAFEESPTAG